MNDVKLCLQVYVHVYVRVYVRVYVHIYRLCNNCIKYVFLLCYDL